MAERMTVAQVAKDVRDLDNKFEEHDKILVRGNGEPSLQEDMRTVQRDIEQIKDILKEQKKMREEEKRARESYLKLFIGLVAAQLLAGIIAAAVYVVRIAPYIDEIIHHVQ